MWFQSNQKSRDFALEHLGGMNRVNEMSKANVVDQFLISSSFVTSEPAKLLLIPVDDTIIGYDSLVVEDVSKYYKDMPIDMEVNEKRQINDVLHWEMRMYAEIPVIVNKSKKPIIATHIAVILGPENVVWTAYPVNGIEGVAPQITKDNI